MPCATELAAVDLIGDAFHPEWNYTIHPRPQPPATRSADRRRRARHRAISANITAMINERRITQRHRLPPPHLSDHELRLWAAAEAIVHGPAATAAVARAPLHDQTRTTRTPQPAANDQPPTSSG